MDHEDGDGLDSGVDGDSRGGMEEPSGGDSGGVPPPPIFFGGSLLSLVSWFCVSPPPPSRKRRGTIFIVGFRSRGSFGTKDRRKRSHEGPDGVPHAAKESGRVGHPLLAFGPPLFRILFPHALFLTKNDPRKFSGHLDVVWVPETQKYRK